MPATPRPTAETRSVTTRALTSRLSLYRSGAGTRLLAAAALSGLVWLAIAWALAA